ncbi:hypothetical protein IWW37_005799 [Coemansia sp. RSA 2050]|nr:hypothetical protein IWW37_005799 [Coemansia sp. RSA 2050]KAJ2729011.1 hypothetical protein IW152_005779 [Coemansia sp. BCRC 34962]
MFSTQQRHHRSNPILCLAPNAAYQTTLLFDQVSLGQVNRATKQTNSLGGKGQNFAIASLGFTGASDRVTLLQILGGSTGTQIEALERQQNIDFITIPTSQQTRTCTTCLDTSTGSMTELVGMSEAMDPAAATEFETVALELVRSSHPPRALALCGTFPPGLCPELVARIIGAARSSKDTMVFVDAVKDMQPTLATGGVDVLKINSSELAYLSSARQFTKPEDAARAAAALANRFSIGVVAVTDGPSAAYLVDAKSSTSYKLCVPDMLMDLDYYLGKPSDKCGQLVLNPLGAGDTCSAVMLNSLIDGTPAVDAFALGLAAASASCLVLMPNCIFDLSAMQRIHSRIAITTI